MYIYKTMNNESNIAGVSIRAIIVLALLSVFAASVFLGKSNDALTALTTAGIGWYFGQKNVLGANDAVESSEKKEV